MCRSYHRTAVALDTIVNHEINTKGQEYSYGNIIKKLKNEYHVEALGYTPTVSIEERLEHLRALGHLSYDFNRRKYMGRKKIIW